MSVGRVSKIFSGTIRVSLGYHWSIIVWTFQGITLNDTLVKNLITYSCTSENRMVRTKSRTNKYWYASKIWHIYPPGNISGAILFWNIFSLPLLFLSLSPFYSLCCWFCLATPSLPTTRMKLLKYENLIKKLLVSLLKNWINSLFIFILIFIIETWL